MSSETPTSHLAEIDREPTPGRWRHFVPGWFTLIAFGFLLYELTAWPALGVLVACGKFGFGDWRAAFWLRHRDPDRGRAWAAFWLYLAAGLFRIALVGVLVFLVLVVAIHIVGRVGNRRPEAVARLAGAELASASIVAFFAFGLTWCTGVLAFGVAWWCRRRLWLHGALADAARKGDWPPSSTGHANRAGLLLWVVVGMSVVALVLAFLVLMVMFAGRMNRGAFGLAAMVLVVSVAVLFDRRRRFAEAVVARTPEECWPTDEPKTPESHRD